MVCCDEEGGSEGDGVRGGGGAGRCGSEKKHGLSVESPTGDSVERRERHNGHCPLHTHTHTHRGGGGD